LKGYEMNINRVFETLVGLGATWILWFLVGLSVIALTVILERGVFFARTRQDGRTLRRKLKRLLAEHRFEELKGEFERAPSLEARIVAAGVGAHSAAEAEERMAAEAYEQRLRSEKNLAFLGTLGNNAPFVGLLGTVVGIIGAFGELDASGGQLTTGLMAEIGEALIATAVGLLVALPAVAAYNTFQRMLSVRLGRGEVLGRELVAFLHAETSARPSGAE
jgi:biopolymer transport protein ExbB